ncbi:hypothetical protein [Bifidobacterium sp. SO1]|uniref:hypothetical protein n=1 Tax=Bifidobacterium sp. SO1 TaxID=2809029 RepID=UPI001BDC8F1F|nr:hypothetical protein [Bifidobacterium sp. SO1]MBT1162150.1 hypothetical protein [Bifidobacterium sp. SO1]
MSIWDNNGFNGGAFGTPQPETNNEPIPFTQPVEEPQVPEPSEPAEPIEPTIEPEDAANEEHVEPAPVEEKKTKRGGGRGRKSKDGFPHLDATVVAKVQEMLDVLADHNTAEAVKVLVGAKSDEPAKLVDELTDERNRKKVADFVKMVDEFAYVDASDMTAQLVMAFMTDKDFAQVLFAVLNAMAPDRGFGSPSKDVMKNAKAISGKWGDGVDLSMLDKLKV